jgi:hypothetical protein
MVGVYTRSYTNYRDGCYVDPSLKLTSSYVQSNGVRVLGSYQLDDPRGTEGQVLIAPQVTVRSGVIRDLAVIADMSNNIYGFNAQPPFNLIWKQPIGNPMTVTTAQDMWGINPFWGVLSTGVIDPETNLWYIVSLSTVDGTFANSVYFLHTISLTDGAAVYPPLALSNVTYTAPSGAIKAFNAAVRKQRAALALTNVAGVKTVYIPFGSFLETAPSNLGWIVAVNVTEAPTVAKAWATGDQHLGAGIWMGGAGLSVDDSGWLHGMTGNGGFAPPGDVGECFLKLGPDLTLNQWWSPYSDAGRAGLDPTLATANSSMQMTMMRKAAAAIGINSANLPDGGPNNAMNAMVGMAPTAATSNVNIVGDQDLGSGGPLYLPMSLTGYPQNILMGGGKDGILWILNADAMGNTLPSDFLPANINGNYAKLLFPPWGWTFNGIGIDLMPTTLDQLPIAVGGYTHHVHGQPVAYLSPDHGLLTFVQGENGPVRAVSINASGTPNYVACGTEIASAGMNPPGGMPGGMLTLAVTAQQANTSVLWSCMPWYGNANRTVTPGRLVAYASNWVVNGNLVKLWDSAEWGIDYAHNKFNIATAQMDKLFVPTYDGRVLILG